MSSFNNSAGIRVYYCRNAAQPKEMTNILARAGIRNRAVVEAVSCCGRIDSRYLLKAFEGGAEAVCVLACPSGDCKLMEGNIRAGRRIESVRKLLAEAGMDANCAQIFFADTIEERKLDELTDAAARLTDSRPLEGMVA